MKISKEQAKRFLIVYHHLHQDYQLMNDEMVLAYIKQIGCIQYDPINVLAYNSHLVLQSRMSEYRPSVLDHLLYESYKLIDAWDKNLSIYHIDDDPYFHRFRSRNYRYYDKLDPQIDKVIPELRQHIIEKGFLSSIDIKGSPQIDWAWAPTKVVRAALDHMFSSGDVYVHHKVNTRKYYDLIERHPFLNRRDNPFTSDSDYYDWHLLRRIRGVGLLPAGTNSYAFIAIDALKASIRRESLVRLLRQGKLVEVEIEGVKDVYHIHKEDVNLLQSIDVIPLSQLAHIIAPLDNLIWDRQMVKQLFDFDYKWEVYEPLEKRKYGYYVIPVLYQHNFVGRFVGKMNRQSQALEVHHFYLEEPTEVTQDMIDALGLMFARFMRFLSADELHILKGCKHSRLVNQVKKRMNDLDQNQ